MDPDSPTPTSGEAPQPDDVIEADLPGWDPTNLRPPLDPLDPDLTTVEIPSATTELDDDEVDRWDDELSTMVGERSEPEAPRPAPSSPRSAGNPTVAEGAANLFSLVAALVGMFADATIGHGSGAFQLHPDEARGIGEPLGRMAARRAPIDANADASDVGDLLQVGVVTTAYVARASLEQFTSRRPAPPAPQEVPT